MTGYHVETYQTASTPDETSLQLDLDNPGDDIVLLVVGGEGTGLLQLSGASLTTLLNVTYSECGSKVIASAGMFAAQLTSGDYTLSLNSTTYDTNSGTSLGAVAYILAPSS